MSSINDIKNTKLFDLGYTSDSLAQKFVDFYRDQLSVTGGSRPDLERAWLLDQLSLSSSLKATPDLWRKVYEAAGYDNPFDYWTNFSIGPTFSDYAANGFTPELVADFGAASEFYGYDSVQRTFAEMFDFTGGLGAVAASDGTLKWNPHNLLTYSEQFDDADWTKQSCTVSANAETAPDGNSTADEVQATNTNTSVYQTKSLTPGAPYKIAIWAKRGTLDWIRIGYRSSADHAVWFDLVNGVVGSSTDPADSGEIYDEGDGWYRLVLNLSEADSGTYQVFYAFSDGDGSGSSTIGDTAYLWGAHIYRSDLGGMDDVPSDARVAGSTTYVPTTSAAVYLPRRGHYTYNGSAWVKRGVLIEPAGVTNLEADALNPAAGSSGNVNVSWSSGASDINGGTEAYALRGDATSGDHYRGFNNAGIAYSSGTTYCYSVWLKPQGSQQYVVIGYGTAAFPTAVFVCADLSAGTIVAEDSGATGFIEQWGDWYRVAIAATADASVSPINAYFVALRNTFGTGFETYSGSTSDGVDVYGHQVVAAAAPSSFILTTGATAARAAETLGIAGAKTPANTTAMSFAVEGLMTYADEGSAGQVVLLRQRADASNLILVDLDTDGAATGEVNAEQIVAGTADEATAGSYTPGVNVAFSVASRHTGSAVQVAKDGTAGAENATPASLADVSSAQLQIGQAGASFVIGKARAWGADITQAGLEGAS